MSKATGIVAENLCDMEFDGVTFDSLTNFVTPSDALRMALVWMIDCADEYYDSEWFPLVATKSIRDNLDWNHIAECLNNEIYERNIYLLFDD